MTSFWFLTIIFAVVIEVISRGRLIAIWFAPAAAVVLILHMLHVSLITELVTFAVLSIGPIMLIRPIAMHHQREHREAIASKVHTLIGEIATVESEISYLEFGKVRIADHVWTASPADAKSTFVEGDKVIITAMENSVAVVKLAEEKSKKK